MPPLTRPRYHLTTQNWMNDPIPFFHAGRWHVFYQHNPYAPKWDAMHWGHAVSDDLIHWEHLPIALAPDAPYDRVGGVWTGSIVEHAGVFYAFYTAVSDLEKTWQTQCVATSTDLTTWTKYEHNPLLVAAPTGFGPCWRDPCVFRDEDGVWKMLVGSQREGKGGALLLYESDDLLTWHHVGVSLLGEASETGADFECPDLFPLGDKWVLLTSRGAVHWQVGDWDGRRFYPQRRGVCDGPPYSAATHDASPFYAAKTAVAANGRRVMFGWLRETNGPEGRNWSGALALPRELRLLPDGSLGIEPARELLGLREDHKRGDRLVVPAWERVPMPGWCGDVCEFTVRTDGGSSFAIILRADGRAHGTEVRYDAAERTFNGAPVAGGRLEIRGFVDRSTIEVFVNGRICISLRTYAPESHDKAFVVAGPRPVQMEWLHSWRKT
ncbi:MAG: glycoside hydrolase family 32 protein [Fimbriimonas sp.]